MGLFDRVFGDARPDGPTASGTTSAPSSDQQAIERYRYLVRTAPPEAIEQAHAEAFAQLSPEQRRRVLEEIGAELPSAERLAAQRAGDQPGALARVATRAEMRQPGSLERAFGRVGAGASAGSGFGGMLAGSFLGAIAGTVIGTGIANHFLGTTGDAPADTLADAEGQGDSAEGYDAGEGFDTGDTFDI